MAGQYDPSDKRERGQTIVEFALVVAVLFTVVLGIIDFSRLFFAYASMSNGVREGARFAIAHAEDQAELHSEIKDRARAMMVIVGGEATIDVNYPDSGRPDPYCAQFCRVEVVATSQFDAWTPLIPAFPIVARATMHFE